MTFTRPPCLLLSKLVPRAAVRSTAHAHIEFNITFGLLNNGEVRILSLCTSQFQLRPSPPGNCGAFARIVSPGGRALAYPRATPGLLTNTWFLTRNPNEDNFIGKDQPRSQSSSAKIDVTSPVNLIGNFA